MLLRSRIHHNNGEHFANTKRQRQQSQASKVTAHKPLSVNCDLGDGRVHASGCPEQGEPEGGQGGDASHILSFKDERGVFKECRISDKLTKKKLV